MKRTALYSKHLALNAKMVPFAGYDMPVSYSGIKAEHQSVRERLGVFDVSHMGEFFVEGEGAESFLNSLTSNDVAALTDGKVQYSCIPNGQGGIVDDLLVYRYSSTRYLLVVNASNIEKDWKWFFSRKPENVSMYNASDDYSLLAVQGPKTAEALQALCPEVNLADLTYYTFTTGSMAGIAEVIISATGYTGAGGFELYVKNEDAEKLWDAVMAAGEAHGILPCGLGCRDTLRLEMGFCLYGNDINDTTSPIEAGLGWITKFNKSFTDKALLEKQKAEGVSRKLVGFVMQEKGIPRQHYRIADANGETLGEVTSGSESLSTGQLIGLGYVATSHSKAGSEIYIDIRGRLLKAVVTKLPFLK
jgi:aminomethyltransferase